MRVCLFSTFYPGDAMPFHVRAYAEDLRSLFDRVVLLTNDDRPVPSSDRAWSRERDIVLRLVPNQGMDFGMWLRALREPGLVPRGDTTELCLANDSCLPIGPLARLVEPARQARLPAFGMTESRERTVHLQSYFLLLRGAGLVAARDFLDGMALVDRDYDAVVTEGELALSSELLAQGVPLAAWVRAEPGFVFNPTLCRGSMLVRLGAPLMKRKLVRGDFDQRLVRAALALGECVGVDACRRVLERDARLPAAHVARLLAADASLARPLPASLARRMRWYRRLRMDRDYIHDARAQPWPGVRRWAPPAAPD